MTSRVSVRPSKASSAVLVVIGTLFLIFGTTLCNTADGDARPYVLMFLVLWVALCGSMIIYGLSILFSKNPPAVTEMEMEGLELGTPGAGIDFESKLRKLESLRKEGLISEAEYQTKRSEIMGEKW